MSKDLTVTNTNTAVTCDVFSDFQAFENAQRIAKMLSQSNIIPTSFRNNVPDCVVALEIAVRTNNSPIVVMQNINIIQGRPTWSSKYLAAALSATKVRQLRYTIAATGRKKVIHTVYEKGCPPKNTTYEIDNMTCRAVAVDRETGETLTGPEISIEMAVKEGWYSKAGSKWQTMPEVMLRYRAATFFANAFYPELSLGLSIDDEEQEQGSSIAGQGKSIIASGGIAAPQAEETSAKAKKTKKAPSEKKAEEPAEDPAIVDASFEEVIDPAVEEVPAEEPAEENESTPAPVVMPQDDGGNEWDNWGE